VSLLFPLYLGGLLAIAAPIVFHMIRRTPAGRVPFSSLMFLRTSPPRLVRRKRLEQIALLCLRALILGLLALAFARPFLRGTSSLDAADTTAGRTALLIDTSASMRRPGLWEKARREAQAVLDGVPADNAVTIFGFDEGLTEVAGLDQLEPTWHRTNLGGALVEAAERCVVGQTDDGVVSQIVVVTDGQRGTDLTELEDYDWPRDLRFELRRVNAAPGNAGLHPGPVDDEGERRVRISNSADAVNDRFTLQWGTEAAAIGEVQSVYCPPGETRTVRAPEQPQAEAERIILTGDGADFDNVLYQRAPLVETAEVMSFGGTTSEEQDVDFFLARVFADERLALSTAGTQPDVNENPLVVLRCGAPDAPATAALLEYARLGGCLLVVLAGSFDEAELRELTGDAGLTSRGEQADDFALLAEIDFDHPLLSPFDDPRYSDFTGIHFWRRRELVLSDSSALRVLMSFEDGSPFLIERSLGAGRVLVMTSSWEPADSDLARSSKFAPLLQGMARLASDRDLSSQTFHVGDRIVVGDTEFTAADAPGYYELEAQGRAWRFAVNLDPEESRTEPLELAALSRAGLPVVAQAAVETPAAREKRARQELGFETEHRQKLWRWLIFAAVAGLLVETAWAGRLARKAGPEPSVET